ncbi:MazG domain-containing protein [Methanobrevibacter millerae]|uniref:MazG domain-containing protein n=2 Tax=Methanobrevibacter millerae TaxID=230361 RepID=A0A0U2L5M5_9EURY|nr:MazG domain-containing protein [Methanobrevibacter millerae]
MIHMDEVKKELIKFQEERDWKKFHTPENLAKSISIEAAELLEHFQWGKEYDIDEVADELADVLIYSMYMADSLNLDIKEIILNKMKKNAIKYPVEKSYGVSTKYDSL